MSAEIIDLQQAIAQHLVAVQITGNPIQQNPQQNSHIGKCLKMQIQNQTLRALDIKITNGTWCSNLNQKNQDLIISENVVCHIDKQTKKQILLFAFCGEKNNSSPSEKDSFQFVKPLNQKLYAITHFIEQNKLFCHTGQVAVWCFTDQEPLQHIYNTHDNHDLEKELIAVVAHELHLPIPSPLSNSSMRIRLYPLEAEGKFSAHVDKPTTHGIYLTDSTHQILETIIPDETERRSGTIRLQFGIRLQFPSGIYHIELKTDNVWSTLQKITLGND